MNRMQNTLRRVRTLIVASLALPTLSAQSVYTLDACIDKALQNNARTQNAGNCIKATIAGLSSLKTAEEIAALRGKSVEEIVG